MFVAGIFGAVIFVVAHVLAARLLRVRGLPIAPLLRKGELAPWYRELAVRLSGLAATYAFAVFCFALIARANGSPGTTVMVAEDRPAFLAGLRQGDRIVAIDGSPVTYFDEIVERVREVGPGGKLSLSFARGAEERTVEVVLDETGKLGVGPGAVVEVGILDAFLRSFAAPFGALKIAIEWFNHQLRGSTEPLPLEGPVASTAGGEQTAATGDWPDGNPIVVGAVIASYHASVALPLVALYTATLLAVDLFSRRARKKR